jgi:hypothetical protein
MSKSNVNPNHYKVAGRERQGEDIAQARNKQKHAESVVRRRTESGAKPRTSTPQEGATSPDVAPARAAKTATPPARVRPVKTASEQKRGRTLVPRSAAPHARFPKAARRAVPMGAAPEMTAKQAATRASVDLQQGADKRGMRSTAQKRAAVSSRHEFDPMPETKAVAGAFGKEPTPRGAATRKR